MGLLRVDNIASGNGQNEKLISDIMHIRNESTGSSGNYILNKPGTYLSSVASNAFVNIYFELGAPAIATVTNPSAFDWLNLSDVQVSVFVASEIEYPWGFESPYLVSGSKSVTLVWDGAGNVSMATPIEQYARFDGISGVPVMFTRMGEAVSFEHASLPSPLAVGSAVTAPAGTVPEKFRPNVNEFGQDGYIFISTPTIFGGNYLFGEFNVRNDGSLRIAAKGSGNSSDSLGITRTTGTYVIGQV